MTDRRLSVFIVLLQLCFLNDSTAQETLSVSYVLRNSWTTLVHTVESQSVWGPAMYF